MDPLTHILNDPDSFIKSYKIPEISSQFIRRFLTQGTYITEGFSYNPILASFKAAHKELPINVDLYKPILYYCNKKGIDESELYKQGNFNRSVLTDIRNMKYTKGYLPKKDILLRICLVLKLTHDETLELLNIAGHPLIQGYLPDMIVSHAITEKYYDITNIDDAILQLCGKYYLQPKKIKDKTENS